MVFNNYFISFGELNYEIVFYPYPEKFYYTWNPDIYKNEHRSLIVKYDLFGSDDILKGLYIRQISAYVCMLFSKTHI